MSSRFCFAITIALVYGVLSHPALAVARYTTTPIGYNFYVEGINSSGAICGTYSSNSLGGLIWQEGKITFLSKTYNDQYTYIQKALDINDHGTVIGMTGFDGNMYICLICDGTVEYLTPIHALDVSYSINNHNQVVGENWLWDDGVIMPLNGNEQYPYFWAQQINDDGQIAGTIGDGMGGLKSVLWNNGVITDLGLPYATYHYINGINNNGQIAGDWHEYGSLSRGYLYSDSILIDLGYSEVNGINNSGQVVGSVYQLNSSTYGWYAGIWDNGHWTNLNDMIDNPGYYSMFNAYAINDSGQIVVGDGNQLYILTPVPEPSSAVGLMIGLVSIITAAGMRRRY